MRGGKRNGAGRPKGDRQHKICIKIQEYTWYLLQTVRNKSAYIDYLIQEDLNNKVKKLKFQENEK